MLLFLKDFHNNGFTTVPRALPVFSHWIVLSPTFWYNLELQGVFSGGSAWLETLNKIQSDVNTSVQSYVFKIWTFHKIFLLKGGLYIVREITIISFPNVENVAKT